MHIHHIVYIVNNHLCAIQQIPGEHYSVWALPFSHIFRERGSYGRVKSSDPIPFLRAQDFLQDSFKAIIPGTSRATIQSMSICTSSWRTPGLCELDAPATPTRIFISFITYSQPHDYNYMVAELLLSPTEATPSSSPSVSSIIDNTSQNGFLLTYERRTLGYSCRPESLRTPTRTGRILAPYSIYSEDIKGFHRYRIAFSMNEFLEGRDGLINVTADEHIMGRPGHFPIDSAIGRRYVVDVEEYSSAMWYRSGTVLFIHHTD